MKKRSWTESQLRQATEKSTSFRQILGLLKLKQAGGNYQQIKKYINELNINIKHFKGRGWNKGLHFPFQPKISLKNILVKDSDFQSYKLKKRLFEAGLKLQRCEECGWAKISPDGRLPLELDHINGNSKDNRIKNLRVLCPNCHSLKPTHRGRNSKS